MDSKRSLIAYLKHYTPLIEVSHVMKKCNIMGRWCNGSTAVSKTVNEGSTPSLPASTSKMKINNCNNYLEDNLKMLTMLATF